MRPWERQLFIALATHPIRGQLCPDSSQTTMKTNPSVIGFWWASRCPTEWLCLIGNKIKKHYESWTLKEFSSLRLPTSLWHLLQQRGFYYHIYAMSSKNLSRILSKYQNFIANKFLAFPVETMLNLYFNLNKLNFSLHQNKIFFLYYQSQYMAHKFMYMLTSQSKIIS